MAMRRKELEMALQRVRNFEDPDPALEQYMTPATMASEIVFEAYRNGDIEGMKVIDLGCGTGMFSIGAWLMGAGMVKGFDASADALRIAEANAAARGADRPFLDKAMEISECVYSIHMDNSMDFVRGYVESRGRRIDSYRTYKYEIPHTFAFHTRTKTTVDVAAVCIR